MLADFWHERWQQNQIGFHQREINSHLETYWQRLKLPSDACVFVPLCGKTRDLLWLRAQGHPVLGVEISPIAVRDFFAENQLRPQVRSMVRHQRWGADQLAILCGDFFSLNADDVAICHGVYDRASLIAMPPGLRERYVRHLVSIVPSTARLLLVTMEYPQSQMPGPPFAVHESEVRALYEPGFAVHLLFTKDVLSENPGFREKGLRSLVEKVYLLTPVLR